jgi:sterol desaturase/sphingolipid hydroxylase (fatty acid hydroxylase superfamily)
MAAAGHGGLAVLATAVHWVVRRLKPEGWLQANAPDAAAYRRELAYACSTLAVGGAITALTVFLAYGGVIQLRAASAWVVVAQCLGYVAVFDAYYYWVHRALHTEPLFRWVHRVHHRSVTPSPLTAYAFHPFEALLTGMMLPLYMWVVTPDMQAVWTIAGLSALSTVLVHCGHELVPRTLREVGVGRWLVTPGRHDLHHSSGGRWNFGAYFVVLDRLVRTYAESEPRPERPVRSAAA